MERRESVVEGTMKKLVGANMDIDLATPINQISWHQSKMSLEYREGNPSTIVPSKMYPFVRISAESSIRTP